MPMTAGPLNPDGIQHPPPPMWGIMSRMATFSHADAEAAAGRHGLAADDFLAAFDDLVDSTASPTVGDRDFLIRHGGVDPAVLTPEAQSEALRVIALATEGANRDVARRGLTTAEVAARFGYQKSNLSRMVAHRDLYVVKQPRGRGSVFPLWQFTDDGALPGLRLILPLIPSDYHPLDIERLMTTPADTLDDRTPRDWLATGGDPSRVAGFVAQLGLA
jgi:hypothetical protein